MRETRPQRQDLGRKGAGRLPGAIEGEQAPPTQQKDLNPTCMWETSNRVPHFSTATRRTVQPAFTRMVPRINLIAGDASQLPSFCPTEKKNRSFTTLDGSAPGRQ